MEMISCFSQFACGCWTVAFYIVFSSFFFLIWLNFVVVWLGVFVVCSFGFFFLKNELSAY